LLVAGDAACFLNPSYGQGMTAAALSATALKGELDRGTEDLSRRFHRAQAKALRPAWTATAASDALWASGTKGLGATRRLSNRVSGEVLRLAVEEPEVARTLLEVKNLLAPPRALLRPGILLPALRRTVF
jgi:2-polyprenyl-6-methoxyphenol hydroxylase-like FAD-dependent oxidoreductase